MGSSSFETEAYYRSAPAAAAAAGTSTRSAASAKAAASNTVIDKLRTTFKNKAGAIIRESRDSADKPETNAVAVFLDVTGSNKHIAEVVVKELPTLMATLTAEAVLPGPHVLFGAVDDFKYIGHRAVQVGQFEGGLETVSDLADIVITNHGGGNDIESYELAMLFMSRYASMDCVEKRDKKGYLFFIADEGLPNLVQANQWNSLMGLGPDDQNYLHEDLSTTDLIAELREKFVVCCVYPTENSYFTDFPAYIAAWRRHLGENVYECPSAKSIVAFITGLIGMFEGYSLADIAGKMKKTSSNPSVVDVATTALTQYEPTTTAVAKGGQSWAVTGAGATDVLAAKP